MNILIVDDDVITGQLLARSLERLGYKAIHCHGGAEAVETLDEKGPALLVLDYEMPGLNGAQVCEEIRKKPDAALSQSPIILLTAHAGEEHEVECLKAGADDFVSKPVNIAVLRARIETHLRL
ncbi:MAG: response regulator transcription factor, partial [Verrucomicrobiota bacterium]|nr:response regulator transcription factor [Verrucomicrobiota bacterium]